MPPETEGLSHPGTDGRATIPGGDSDPRSATRRECGSLHVCVCVRVLREWVVLVLQSNPSPRSEPLAYASLHISHQPVPMLSIRTWRSREVRNAERQRLVSGGNGLVPRPTYLMQYRLCPSYWLGVGSSLGYNINWPAFGKLSIFTHTLSVLPHSVRSRQLEQCRWESLAGLNRAGPGSMMVAAPVLSQWPGTLACFWAQQRGSSSTLLRPPLSTRHVWHE